jgi:hypothetical protein
VPILPLDHPEPFAATLGVMLYPRTDNDDPAKARAFASQFLATPIRRAEEAGYELPREVLKSIAMAAGYPLDDLEKRWWGGWATGELFKTLWALFNTDPALASWNNAVKIAELVAARARASGSRSLQWEAKRRFLPAAHLWAAWVIREGQFAVRFERGYAEFQLFLAEAEYLRSFGQTAARTNQAPYLPADVWKVPENWDPSIPVLKMPSLTLPADLLSGLRPAGRPRRARNA